MSKKSWRREASKMVSLRIPNQVARLLESVAAKEKRSRSEQIVYYIKHGLVNEGHAKPKPKENE